MKEEEEEEQEEQEVFWVGDLLTEISSFVVYLECPDAEGRFSPVMDGHERPRVESVAGRVVRPQRQ